MIAVIWAGTMHPGSTRALASAPASLNPAHADGAELDDARDTRPGAGGLEVEDDVVGQLERGRRGAVRPRPSRRAPPRPPSATRASGRRGRPRRQAGGRAQRARSAGRRDRPRPRSARRVRDACTRARAGGPRHQA